VVKEIKANFQLVEKLISLRPKQPTELSDDQWAQYLFMRKNIKGVQFERWNHAHGCRKWFNMIRDTSNDKIHAVYKMGEKPPKE